MTISNKSRAVRSAKANWLEGATKFKEGAFEPGSVFQRRSKSPSTRLDDWETSRFSGCLDYDDGVCFTHFFLLEASRDFRSPFATDLLSLGYDFSYVRACTIERRYPARYACCPCITLLFRFCLLGHVMQRPGWVYLKKEVWGILTRLRSLC